MRIHLRHLGRCAPLALVACGPVATPATAPPVESRPAPTRAEIPAQAPLATASATAAGIPPKESAFHIVLQSHSLISSRGYAVPGGGLLVGDSLLATVSGDEVRQDPAWLEGVPAYINWDAEAWAVVPILSTPPGATIPMGTLLVVHAGNRHGPGAELQWTARGWRKGPPPLDARLRGQAPAEGSFSSLLLPTGHLFAVRTSGRRDAPTELLSFAPGERTPTIARVPLTDPDRTDVHLAAASPDPLYVCSFLSEILELRAGAWTPLKMDGVTPNSCAVTSDGTLWVVAFSAKPKLLRRSAGGAWDAVELPKNVAPDQVSAAGDRVWVSAQTSKPDGFAVLSNVPVKTPLLVSDLAVPGSPYEGFSGLAVESQEVPSVSAAPAGPGTAACTSLVVYLGKTLAKGLGAALAKHPEMADLPLVEVAGAGPGKAVLVGGTANMDVVPESRRVPAIATIPKSYEHGMAIVTALAADLPAAPPRLLCAVPRIVKQLGPAGRSP